MYYYCNAFRIYTQRKYDEEKEVVGLLGEYVAWANSNSIRDIAISQSRLMLNDFNNDEEKAIEKFGSEEKFQIQFR